MTFTPATSFRKGTATFTYTVSDGASGTGTATVTVTVPDNAPVAADDSASTPSATAIDVDVLANDTDDNVDPLTVTGVVGAAHGTATVTGSGAAARVRYVPAAGWFGPDTMTYTISDGTGTATALVTVTTGSAAPVAADLSRTVPGGGATTIDVLSHVTDADTAGSGLTTTGTGGAAHGTVSVNGAGAAVYTPDPAYAGADSFTYTVSDPQGNTATATVTLTVANQAPSAGDDSAVVPHNGSVDVAVLLNDGDANGDPLTVSVADRAGPRRRPCPAWRRHPLHTDAGLSRHRHVHLQRRRRPWRHRHRDCHGQRGQRPAGRWRRQRDPPTARSGPRWPSSSSPTTATRTATC